VRAILRDARKGALLRMRAERTGRSSSFETLRDARLLRMRVERNRKVLILRV
jgi:hypothetical protein